MFRNLNKVVQLQKAKFATAPAPQTKPEVLYTGVSICYQL